MISHLRLDLQTPRTRPKKMSHHLAKSYLCFIGRMIVDYHYHYHHYYICYYYYCYYYYHYPRGGSIMIMIIIMILLLLVIIIIIVILAIVTLLIVTLVILRSVFRISCLFLRPRPWQFEIRDSTDK